MHDSWSTHDYSILYSQFCNEISVLKGRRRESMQEEEDRGFCVACLAIENIYAIDGDSLNGSEWHDRHFFVEAFC